VVSLVHLCGNFTDRDSHELYHGVGADAPRAGVLCRVACRGASYNSTLDRNMSTRWIHELAIPGNPDISSVYASYAFAGILAGSFLLAHLYHFWPWFTLGMIAAGLQVPLLLGILFAKFRAPLPPPTGHAQMFPDPEPFADIGWLRALGGFMTSAVVISVYALYEKAFAV